MARGINKVMIMGNLGADPEVRYMPNGGAITNIRVATSEVWKDKQSGEKQERTEWHKIVLFNRIGEIAAQYLRKGSRVFIEGSLRTNKWQDQSGNDRYTTEIIANEMQLMDSKGGGSGSSASYDQANEEGSASQMSSSNAPRSNATSANKASAPAAAMAADEPFDDDIPF